MALLSDFRAAAIARTRFPDDERLTTPALFALVREMPFGRLPDEHPDTVIREWRASAIGKHVLLQALAEEFGLHTMLICALHEFGPQTTPWLPPALLADLEADGPVPDLHMFLRLKIDDDWITIDATWPLAAAPLGFPVNERFEAGREMRIACDPDEIQHVPPEADPIEFAGRLIASHVGGQAARRVRFLDALAEVAAAANER